MVSWGTTVQRILRTVPSASPETRVSSYFADSTVRDIESGIIRARVRAVVALIVENIRFHKGRCRFAFYKIGRCNGNVPLRCLRNYHSTSWPLRKYHIPRIHMGTSRKLYVRGFKENAAKRKLFSPEQLRRQQWE